ncbi:MAG: DDE-type integrase/transposase/recombinase, partial [Flavobacteriaceae bacterium]|nr:DDE-type integrase/transposase/recombinase [Flavobacteriaceae bacterium]
EVLCESLLFHYVLTFSKWEYFELCVSESFESLSSGFQNAVFTSGGVPLKHQTDSLTAAINKNCSRDRLTDRYSSLIAHYKIESQNTNARCPNENGTVEVMHGHLKKSIIHALEMRGSYNFENYKELKKFLKKLNKKKNSNRHEKFLIEKKKLKPLPTKMLPAVKKEKTKVGSGSTIRAGKKTYSVESKLIGETVMTRLFSNRVEVWYGDKLMDSFDRIFGEVQHKINYRHVIKWFVRKPGAFENYYYKADMYPTTYFRMAYDQLNKKNRVSGTKTYLEILKLAAFDSEAKVNKVLNTLLDLQEEISFEKVKKMIETTSEINNFLETKVTNPDLADYDNL